MRRWEDVYLLGSGAGEVFHLNPVNTMEKIVELDSQKCISPAF
jgi:hypothetical protein